jgi:hypothetical protein
MEETKFHIHTKPQAKLWPCTYILIFKFFDSNREGCRA